MEKKITMYSEIEFRNYLYEIGNWNTCRLNNKRVVDALCIFSEHPYNILGISRASFRTITNKVFSKIIVDKPVAVKLNIFLLYTFGYRKCATCIIMPLLAFGKDNSTWAGISNKCKLCRTSDSKNRYQAIEDKKSFNKINYEKRKEYLLKYSKQYYNNNKEDILKKDRDRYS